MNTKGVILDLAALLAFTALALAHALPEAVVASAITMIVVARYRGPGDGGSGGGPTAGAVGGVLWLWNIVRHMMHHAHHA